MPRTSRLVLLSAALTEKLLIDRKYSVIKLFCSNFGCTYYFNVQRPLCITTRTGWNEVPAKVKTLKKPKSRTQYDFKNGNDFRLKLANKYQLLVLDAETTQEPRETDPEQLWNDLKVSILESAKETLNVKRTQPRKPWVTPKTFAVIEEKRSLSPQKSERYRQLKRKVRGSLRRDRRTHLEGICGEMEEYQKRNDSKGTFAVKLVRYKVTF